MRIGICGGDRLFLQKMESSLTFLLDEKGMTGQVFCFPDAGGMMEHLRTEKLDLVFLEVEGTDGSAFDTAREIAGLLPACDIAYYSDTLESAADAYETKHFYFLRKEELPERLDRVISRAVELRLESRAKVCIYSCGKNELVPVNEIMYAERSGKKSYVHLADGTLLETPEKIDEIAQKLEWPQFTRCHNSFVVSFESLRTYTRHQLIMEDGREIPVSRPYLVKVRKSFAEWNKKNL